jgi:hypothetical protein
MDRTCSAAEAAFIAQEIRAHMDSSSATCDSSDTALSAGRAETSAQNDAETSARRLYGHIFRSSACWAICLAHTAGDIGLYVLDDGLPPYLRDVKGVELSQIGLMLALPGLLKPCIILLSHAARTQGDYHWRFHPSDWVLIRPSHRPARRAEDYRGCHGHHPAARNGC